MAVCACVYVESRSAGTVEGSTLSVPVRVTSHVSVACVSVHPQPSAQTETLDPRTYQAGLQWLDRRLLQMFLNTYYLRKPS